MDFVITNILRSPTGNGSQRTVCTPLHWDIPGEPQRTQRILSRLHRYRYKVMVQHRAATLIALAVQTIGLLPDGGISVSTCYTHTPAALPYCRHFDT